MVATVTVEVVVVAFAVVVVVEMGSAVFCFDTQHMQDMKNITPHTRTHFPVFFSRIVVIVDISRSFSHSVKKLKEYNLSLNYYYYGCYTKYALYDSLDLIR